MQFNSLAPIFEFTLNIILLSRKSVMLLKAVIY